MKKKKNTKIKYDNPPMKYNPALQKYEIDLTTVKPGKSETKTNNIAIIATLVLILIFIGFMLWIMVLSKPV